ncbi:MAG TPA: nucleotidyltransferase family protein [Acidimicrobiales bacterium]|nr:nucleotidyltransferase family protein [Acidimicrobiales bacterium]
MLEAMAAHHAPSPPERADELTDILASSDWFLATLDRVATVDPPQWWVGAGVIRDLVWDTRFGEGFDPARLKDVDVAYFDGTDLTTDREVGLASELRELDPSIVWDVKNQAAVHQWYPARFGLDVQPFQSVSEAVATWPEYAACVAVRHGEDGSLLVLAPHGLDDLLDGVWRRNPTRVTPEEYERRLRRKDPAARWRGMRVTG